FSRDWSSDVCSSDLVLDAADDAVADQDRLLVDRSGFIRCPEDRHLVVVEDAGDTATAVRDTQQPGARRTFTPVPHRHEDVVGNEIGTATCSERWWIE